MFAARSLFQPSHGLTAPTAWIVVIAPFAESRGRSPGIGYAVRRRDGRRVILDHAIKTSWAAAFQMLRDIKG